MQFFFLEGETAFALVSLFSGPDRHILEESYETLYVCEYLGAQTLTVVPVSCILSVVAMIPWEEDHSNLRFLVEKPGLDISSWGTQTEMDDGEGDEEDE